MKLWHGINDFTDVMLLGIASVFTAILIVQLIIVAVSYVRR